MLQNVNSYCSRSACNQMVAEFGGEGYRARWWSDHGGCHAVVRPAVGTGCRWQSRKKEGEENLQERKGPAVYALPLVRS